MNRLKELRQEKKLSQKEMALELQTPLRTYQRWENGESQIKPDKAQALADYFGVSVGYLLGYSEYEKTTDIKNLVYDTPYGGAAGIVYDEIAKKIGEKRMKRFLENTASNTFIQFSMFDNDNDLMHTKEAEMILLFELLDNSDKQLVFDLIKSLSDKIVGEDFEGYPLNKWLELEEKKNNH
ncbi:helix-turn-helix domain-containing protein [Streptococcus dysgalactiae]|uniref:helix-turn-helix domain-containing protein n=1 Tax=Streptococcus dysgalactiae TaxID=1334 RepID=UPI000E059674|nr:helix-turn-helix transcriptional regulator [Streptococcus dysgalactiae]SUN44568.1 XRE family transcriptional regulator [Streptococcus dysgalactiae subsp. dysgalactiae]SUN49027.1 XRE family transcriptional regulator [Streptococcus dysgalactiae]SUN54784.1 XRE family transcriptional regulator [Streptococcus dysgalactiae]